jgi:adenine/guanine phosphoribosyltransferase-like PRPP-binding protein
MRSSSSLFGTAKIREGGGLILIGFSGAVRNVVSQLELNFPDRSVRTFTLLSYDLPTKEELSAQIQPDDEVILVTDVISSGALTKAVIGIIRSLGVEIVGLVSLVVGRYAEENPELDVFSYGSYSVPLVIGANISNQLRTGQQMSFGEKEYWVDPVSLIPVESRVWGWDETLDHRIKFSIQVLTTGMYAKCGHVVDGSRHSSVFVELAQLIKSDESGQVYRRVRDECMSRLDIAGWSGFTPTVILYPSGISRMVRNDEGIGSFHSETGAARFLELLAKIWPGVPSTEIARTFDPGGEARCAADAPTGISLARDVVVADDGIWRGNTTRELIQVAARAGARRILVVTLLNRLSGKEAANLEAQKVLRDTNTGEDIEVCYCLPMLFPVPYTSASNSPYEVTRRRLADRAQAFPWLRRSARRILDDLAGHHPSDLPFMPEAYTRTWIETRVYAELATENEALEALKELVGDAQSDEEIHALLNLFLHEWSLLGRGRMRHAVAPRILEKAMAVLGRENVDLSQAQVSLSLIRSVFPTEFLQALDLFLSRSPRVSDIDFFERMLLHITTLDVSIAASKSLANSIRAVCDSAELPSPENVDSSQLRRWRNALRSLRLLALSEGSKTETISRLPLPVVAEETIKLIESDVILHEAKGVVGHFASLDIPYVLSKGMAVHLPLLERWSEKHEPYLRENLAPLLARLAHALYRCASFRGELREFTTRYFQKDNLGRVRSQFTIGMVDFPFAST